MFNCIINIDILGLHILLYHDNCNTNEVQVMVATDVNYGVASFSNWLELACNYEIGIMKVRRPLTTTTFF